MTDIENHDDWPDDEPEAPAPPPEDPTMVFYTVLEVADIMRVTGDTVRAWVHDKALPAFKAGRSWRIRKSDLAAFVGTQFGDDTDAE